MFSQRKIFSKDIKGFKANCQLSTVNYQLSIVNYQLSTVNCQLSIVNYQLSIVNCQLSTIMVLLYPGSFNPVHSGHLRLAEYALQETQAEELWFIVSPNNPLKSSTALWDEQLRFDLLQTAITNKHNMRVSDVEFALPRPSYTAITLRTLQVKYPDTQFALLIGEDNMLVFDKWREADWILAHYPIYVYPRAEESVSDNFVSHQVCSKFNILNHAPLCPISSTQIRERLQQVNTETDFQQDDILCWLPQAIHEKIKETFI